MLSPNRGEVRPTGPGAPPQPGPGDGYILLGFALGAVAGGVAGGILGAVFHLGSPFLTTPAGVLIGAVAATLAGDRWKKRAFNKEGRHDE